MISYGLLSGDHSDGRLGLRAALCPWTRALAAAYAEHQLSATHSAAKAAYEVYGAIQANLTSFESVGKQLIMYVTKAINQW